MNPYKLLSIILATILVCGCVSQLNSTVAKADNARFVGDPMAVNMYVIHDNENNVTIYSMHGKEGSLNQIPTISAIPDWQLHAPANYTQGD